MAAKLIGEKPNDTQYSGYTGRAFVKEVVDTVGSYYDFGFVCCNIFVDNKGSAPITLSFKTVSKIDEPVTTVPTTIHSMIDAGTSRIFRHRFERYVNVAAVSGTCDVQIEAW